MSPVVPVLLLATCSVAGLLLILLGLPGLWVMVLGVIMSRVRFEADGSPVEEPIPRQERGALS